MWIRSRSSIGDLFLLENIHSRPEEIPTRPPVWPFAYQFAFSIIAQPAQFLRPIMKYIMKTIFSHLTNLCVLIPEMYSSREVAICKEPQESQPAGIRKSEEYGIKLWILTPGVQHKNLVKISHVKELGSSPVQAAITTGRGGDSWLYGVLHQLNCRLQRCTIYLSNYETWSEENELHRMKPYKY